MAIELQPQPVPKRKALLIGINYCRSKNEDDILCGAAEDAQAMRDLLLEYGYKNEDITLMLDMESDEWEADYLRPTYINIMRELDNLVRDARSGDHFVFLYAGHGSQQPQLADAVNKEADALDEIILPVDYLETDQYIIDDDLNSHLIKPLPPGSHFVAIFDCCHSGSMLDLPHDACNSHTFGIVDQNKMKNQELASRKPPVPVLAATEFSSRAVEKDRLSPMKTDIEFAFPTSIWCLTDGGFDGALFSSPVDTTYAKPFTDSPSRKPSMDVISLPAIDISAKPPLYIQATDFESETEVTSPSIKQPVPTSTAYECSGDCDNSSSDGAHVISLSACCDPQESLETEDGQSMTTMLINALKKNKRPSLKELVTEISQQLFAVSSAAQKINRRNRERHDKSTPVFPTAELFQEPLISSLYPLKSDVQWDL